MEYKAVQIRPCHAHISPCWFDVDVKTYQGAADQFNIRQIRTQLLDIKERDFPKGELIGIALFMNLLMTTR